MNVVVIDDQVHIRKGLKDILTMYDDEFQVKAFGSTGIKQINNGPVDLLIIDCNLKYYNALSVIEHFTLKNVPVIVLTNEMNTKKVLEVLRLRVRGYLSKKMGTDEIFNALRHRFKR